MSLHNWTNKNIIVEDTSSYMLDQDFDIVEEARGKKIADPLRAKLMGMEDIRDLKGTMTPRYFATKVIRFLQKQNPELDLENLSDDDIQNAINVVSNVSKPLASRPDVKITTRERGTAKEGLKKGDSGFETLQLNLGGDKVFKSEGGVGDNDLYTTISDGLKYRVTLNKFKGTKLNLDDIKQDDVVSVVIVKPSETEKVDKFGGEIEMGDREKLVADFPEGESEPVEDEIEDIEMHDKFYELLDKGDDEGAMDILGKIKIKNPEMYNILLGAATEDEIDYKKADLDKDGKLSDYEKARAEAAFGDDDDEEDAESCSEEDDPEDDDKVLKKERERAGQEHARAVADHYEDAERCPVTGRLRKKSDEESCDDEEEEQEVALSPQAIQQAMIERGRLEMQRHHQIERMFRHGY
jgi:hypothetical protein